MVLEGLGVGIFAGVIVTLYRIALQKAESFFLFISQLIHTNPPLLVLWCAGLVLMCFTVARLMQLVPASQGSGIPQVDAEVMDALDMPWYRVLTAKFIEGTLCALGGLSLGREGPSVLLGAMSGKGLSKLLGRDRGEERLLVTCGAAAGMSAAFNAPLTGVLFAVEEIHKEFSAPLIVSVMCSAIGADFLVAQVLGVEPVLQFLFVSDLPHMQYLYVLLFGILLGIAGFLHNKGMFFATEKLYAKITTHLPYARLAVPFAAALGAILLFPQLAGGGDALVSLIELNQKLPLNIAFALLVGKYLYTTLCFGSGAPGGTLFPLCVMGAFCGYCFAYVAVGNLGLSEVYITNFMVLGIAGLFASVVQAPVTAVVLAFELTGSLDALLSVSIVSISSYVVANLLKTDAFYEHLLHRLLADSRGDKNSNKRALRDTAAQKKLSLSGILYTVTVGAGSYAENKTLQEISWPGDARVISVTRAETPLIPRGDTRLEALDEVLIMVQPTHENLTKLKALFSMELTKNWKPKSSILRKQIKTKSARAVRRFQNNRANQKKGRR